MRIRTIMLFSLSCVCVWNFFCLLNLLCSHCVCIMSIPSSHPVYSASKPSHVRYFTLIFQLTIHSNLWLYRIVSCSLPSVLCFRRPLNSVFFRAIHLPSGLVNKAAHICTLYSVSIWTTLSSSSLIYGLYFDRHLFILVIYVCIRPSTLLAI